MRPKLPLLALCLCALRVLLGQNEPALVGIPEVGITLTGRAEHPEIANNSGRGMLGYVILSHDANGRESFMHTLKTRDLRLALVRPTSAPPVWSYGDTSTRRGYKAARQLRQWRPPSSGYSPRRYLRQRRICRLGQWAILRDTIGAGRWRAHSCAGSVGQEDFLGRA
jgi:hypothetical protein